MTAPEVEWVLAQMADVADSVATDYSLSDERDSDPVQLRRVDRDDSQIYDGDETVAMSEPLPERKGKLESGAYVGVASVDSDETPIGTGYDLDLERVVGLRLEGLHHAEYGHIDPSGEDGIPFAELKRRVRTALYDQRRFPDAGAANVSFTHLQLTNVADTSSDWRDFYRWDADIVFDGFEELS
jgi:hypothetical protein